MPTKKAKEAKKGIKHDNLEYVFHISTYEIKNAVEKGLIDPMLNSYLSKARNEIIKLIEDKYVG